MSSEFIDIRLFREKINNSPSFDNERQIIRDTEKNNYDYYIKLRKTLLEYQKKEEVSFEKKEESISQEFNVPSSTYDISYYVKLLEGCSNTQEIGHYLPKRKHPDFFLLLNLLCSHYFQEIGEMEHFILKEDISKSDKQDFLKEIQERKEFIQALINYRDKKEFTEEEVLEEEELNTIIYLESSSGNCYALSDIKKISSEYYPSFLELFLSIQNGTFKNIKTFFTNYIAGGLLEVKNPEARIVFQRVQKNIYIIVAIFVKKVDSDSYYREYLENRVMNLKKFELSIINEKYLIKQQEMTEQVKLELGGNRYGRSKKISSNIVK